MRVLITGGAGFIGGNVALGLAARHPDWELTTVDNLRRRGAELNLPRLKAAAISFAHGDIRVLEDLLDIGEIDALVECSAEPSALAGIDGSPDYVVKSNRSRRRSPVRIWLGVFAERLGVVRFGWLRRSSRCGA